LPGGAAVGHHAAMIDIECVTIDCADPRAVASFWNDALGWGGVAAIPDGSGAITGPRSGGFYLEFVRVPDAKVVKNRVHLGCSAGRLDQLDAEIERLERLGATVAWEEEFPAEIAVAYRNVVLRDPEGNEFCLSGRAVPPAAAAGSSS
jgi:predicted enzyme related to lactoylglutathione lyase